MSEVVASVASVSNIIAEITITSQEQCAGIEQIDQAVAQMDGVTQQNASLVEEAAAAAESLRDQASHLVQTVSIFKTHDSHVAASAKHRAAPTETVTAGDWEEF